MGPYRHTHLPDDGRAAVFPCCYPWCSHLVNAVVKCFVRVNLGPSVGCAVSYAQGKSGFDPGYPVGVDEVCAFQQREQFGFAFPDSPGVFAW